MKLGMFILILISGLVVHCGGTSEGGSEAGNPTSTRSVTGSVETTPAALNFSQALEASSGTCLVDTVIATDSLTQTTSTAMDDTCAFSLSLAVGKAYTVSFVVDDIFVATLIVNDVSSAVIASSVFVVSTGDADIDLGLIIISDGEAFPTNRPTTQNDHDGDGISDDDDDDDDDDGQSDSDEGDCDLDGFIDDYDDDSACDDDSSSGDSEDGVDDTSSGQILEVSPRNDEDHVGAEESIQVRFNCEIDADTVNAETFTVTNSSGEILTCDFTYHESGEEVECEHDDNFVNNDTYTATIDGIACENGDAITVTTWSWDTEASTGD